MVKKIIWSKRALKDRLEILEYWILRNKSNRYSIKLNAQFSKTTALLSAHPLIGKKTDIESVRVKVIGDYLIFYAITTTEVRILSIKDGRQNPDTLRYFY